MYYRFRISVLLKLFVKIRIPVFQEEIFFPDRLPSAAPWHIVFMYNTKQTIMFKALIGGFVGAATVTLLNESMRRMSGITPRLDKLGEEATAKAIESVGGTPPTGDRLYATSLAADLLSNTLYYSTAAANKDHALFCGAGLGVLAGLGAVYLPEQMGLDPLPTAETDAKKWITIGTYTLGGLIAGAVITRLLK
jgi:hypothetical protein